MKKIILLVFIAISLTQYGNYGPPKIASISGTIVDQKTDKPVSYATITLFSIPENEAIDGVMCDEEGAFMITELTPGTYKIVIESIGYEKNIINNFGLNRENGIKRTLGIIKLNPKAIDLDAINVIEERSLYEFETDKMVYNAADDIISSGGTAEDVLRKVPMVTVNLDGEVSLRGNSNVKILIDGRDSRFGSEVDNIPSSLIDQVEVITSPSAKYDPEGMAGIINIKLKKGKYTGLNGKIKLNGRHNDIATFDEMNGFTTFINYRGNKFNLYSNLNLKNRFNIRKGWNQKDSKYGCEDCSLIDTTESFHYSYANESIKPNKTFKFGGDYFISDQLTLNSEISWGTHINNTSNTQIITEPIDYTKNSGEEEDDRNYDIEGIIGIDKSFDNSDKELMFELSFDHAYDKEKEFTSSEQLINLYDDSKIYYCTNDNYDNEDDCEENDEIWLTDQITINDETPITETYDKINIDFSYKIPLNETDHIEFGYDGRMIDTDENMNLQITDTLGYTLKTNINSLFKRYIHGFYFEQEHKLNERFSVKQGLRTEYVIREIYYEKMNEEIGYYDSDDVWNSSDPRPDDDYDNPDLVFKLLLDDRLEGQTSKTDKPNPEFEFYPSLHFTYNLSNKKSIQFGLSKRVERPGSSGHGGGKMQIRPFPRNLYAEGNVFIGNPFLKSAYTTISEISYKTPIPMGFMMLNGHYSYTKNPIKWDSITDYGTTKNVTTFQNSENGTEYGTDFFIMIMGQTLGGGITKSKFNHSNGDSDLNEETTHMNMFMGINFPEKYIKLFDFEFGFYWMKYYTGSGSMFGENGTIWANTGIGKSFFDNQFKVSLKLNNLFDAGGFQMDETNEISNRYDSNEDGVINGYDTFQNGRDWNTLRTNMSHSGRPRTLTINFTYSFGEMEDDKYKRRRGHGHDDGGMDMGGF